MNKIQITCYNRQILVDEDQVKLHTQKSAIIDAISNKDKPEHKLSDVEAEVLFTKLLKLNKRIRKNVQFV